MATTHAMRIHQPGGPEAADGAPADRESSGGDYNDGR